MGAVIAKSFPWPILAASGQEKKMDGLETGAMGEIGGGAEVGMMEISGYESAAMDDGVPLPRLPSWGHMVDHLSGASVAPATQRKGRKVSFETAEDKRED
jgi:hypothetical protein